MQAQRCHFCNHIVSLVHVHGHYQCPVCNTNALPCCDGDNCDTNHLLAEKEIYKPHIAENSSNYIQAAVNSHS